MATIRELHEYQLFLHRLKSVMALSGLSPVAKRNLFFRTFPYVLFSVSFLSAFATFNSCVKYQSNMEIMMKSMGVFITTTATDLKILCVILNWRDMRELHETLDNIFLEVSQDRHTQRHFLKRFTATRRLSTTLIIIAFLAIGTFVVAPIASFTFQWANHIHPIRYQLALPAVYPWPISSGSYLYYFHLSAEMMSCFAVFVVACSVDALFPVYIFQISGQLDAMTYQLDALKADDNYDTVIRECAKKHQLLLRCRDIVEAVYGPIIIWMLMTTAIVLCSLTFQLSKLESFVIARVFPDVAYMASKMLQMFIYASSGTVLTSASETFAEAIYIDRWPETGRKKSMSSILIMLTQKPLFITACRYSVVSIDLFAEILNTTVSYFLLLKTMDEK